MSRAWLTVALGVVALAVLAIGQDPTLASQNSYVDSAVCSGCHREIAAAYARTGMARSFSRFDPTHRFEDFTRANPFYHERSGTWYAARPEGADLVLRRWRAGPGGEEIHVDESKIDYVMGSGNHARTYLHRTARGALVELPLGWYRENGGTWAMSPGYDRDYYLSRNTIAYECMFCHNGYPAIPDGHAESGAEPLYKGPLPEGIDCQRCHGPGGNHLRAATAKASSTELRAAIVNPARLPAASQMEVCMQCHLETTSLRLPHSIRRFDRGPFSYQPGTPLGDFQIYFDHQADSKFEGDFEIVSSAYRLRKSKCFLQSAGKLTCTSCHNPHDATKASDQPKYDAVCAQCHSTASLASAKHPAPTTDCASCHMPKRRARDVVHAVMTDHWIQRHPSSKDLLAALPERTESEMQYRGEVVAYYPSPLSRIPQNDLYVAVAQVTQQSNPRGLARLSAEVARQKPARAEFHLELGQAWLSARKPANAIPPLEEALRLSSRSPVAFLNLADALTQARQPQRAIALLERALKLAPNDALLWYQLGLAHSAAGHAENAIAALRRSIAADPDLTETHNQLGTALATSGHLDAAQKEFDIALRIHPDSPEALGNLGHLLASKREYKDASFYFARSVKLRPSDAEVLTNYAVTLASLGRFDDALGRIEAAIRADPKSAEAHNFRGVLLERQGKPTEALEAFLTASRLQADFGTSRLHAARLLAQKGDVTAAIKLLHEAIANSSDPTLRSRAQAALDQINKARK